MVDSKICPFCKNENLCEAHILNNNCWCNNIKVPIELRDYVPDSLKMRACICKECILSFKENSDSFLKKYKLTK